MHLKTGKCLPTPYPEAHFRTLGVTLTHTETCPAAQEELGGLGDGAVIGAIVRGMEVADVQAVGVMGTPPMDTKLVLADVCAIRGFAQQAGKYQELEILPLLAPAVPVHPSMLLLQLTEDFCFTVSLG